MGPEVSKTERIAKDPNSTTDYINRRVFTIGGREVLILEAEKGVTNEAPKSFTLTWKTKKDDFVLLSAVTDLYLNLREKFDFPDDAASNGIASEIRSRALSSVSKHARHGYLSEFEAEKLRIHRNKIEPFQPTFYSPGQNKGMPQFFYPDEPELGLKELKTQLLDHFPDIDLVRMTIETPFFNVEFDGDASKRIDRHVSFSSRYRLIGGALEFLRVTSAVPIDISQRKRINALLRPSLRRLLPLSKAA